MEGLVGDIGGTNARFAMATFAPTGPVLRDTRSYANKDYPSAEAAIEAYLADVHVPRPPHNVVLAVAGPVTNGEMGFTNLDWELSETRLRREGGFARARLVNDFAAQALGAPRLSATSLRRIGPDVDGMRNGTVAVLGPGTGFGVAGLLREDGRETVLTTEGGHVGFAPCDEAEVEIWRRLLARHGRVSVERILSGQGFYELYLALAEIEGAEAECADQEEVQARAGAGDPLASGAVDRFCRILGAVAGDIALGLGARGGVYVTGGVAQHLEDDIARGGFRHRFEAKGRFHDYMRAIPTFLITDAYTALIGAAQVLGSLEPA